MRPQLLELLVISANAIGEIDAGGGLTRCESGSRSIALAAAGVLVVVLAEAGHTSPQSRSFSGHPSHQLKQRLGVASPLLGSNPIQMRLNGLAQVSHAFLLMIN